MEGSVRHKLLKYQKHVLGKSLKSLSIIYILLGEYMRVPNTAEYNTVKIWFNITGMTLYSSECQPENINQQTRQLPQRTPQMCLPELNHCLLSGNCREKFTFYSILWAIFPHLLQHSLKHSWKKNKNTHKKVSSTESITKKSVYQPQRRLIPHPLFTLVIRLLVCQANKVSYTDENATNFWKLYLIK